MEWISILVLTATLIVLVFYTIETYRIRKINAQQKDLQLLPAVIVYFKGQSGQEKVYIENIGHGTAIDLKVASLAYTENQTRFKFSFNLSGDSDILSPLEDRELNIYLSINGNDDLNPLKNFVGQLHPRNLKLASIVQEEGNKKISYAKELRIRFCDITGQQYETKLRFSAQGTSIVQAPKRI